MPPVLRPTATPRFEQFINIVELLIYMDPDLQIDVENVEVMRLALLKRFLEENEIYSIYQKWLAIEGISTDKFTFSLVKDFFESSVVSKIADQKKLFRDWLIIDYREDHPDAQRDEVMNWVDLFRIL